MSWFAEIFDWLTRRKIEALTPEPSGPRGPTTHVIVLDGTLASIDGGHPTNAGMTWLLLNEARRGARISLYYEPGLQWQGWRHIVDLAAGRGINRQIRRAYGVLASRYRPGDRIFLFGYSRGAFAVRSLAGFIDRVGLLRREEATERAILLLYRRYQTDPDSAATRRLARRLCHERVEIEMIGIWDTVKALGFRSPLRFGFSEVEHRFHNHHLGPSIKHGFHALALHETRTVFSPVLWECPPGWTGHVEQVWFRGAHGDVGGQIGGLLAARPLANIPLVWMLERAEICGLPLPNNWRARFPCDGNAPMVGTWSQWGKLFLRRRRRIVGRDPSESIHPTAQEAHRPGPLERLFRRGIDGAV
jgi:uncharacterized protein (DUF2235 family)